MSDTKITDPQISIKFLFNHTDKLAETRQFYSELIGLTETAFNEEWGYLCYQCGGFEFMFFRSESELHKLPDGWASQPGYEGGKVEATSWAILLPEDQFRMRVKKLRTAGVECFSEKPEWRQRSYWGFTVKDPNGVTVELYTPSQERVETNIWQDDEN